MIKLSDAAMNYIRIKALGTPHQMHTAHSRVMVWEYENNFYVNNEKDLEAVEVMVAKNKPKNKEEVESTGVKGNYDHVTRTATLSFITNQCEFERLFERITCNVKSGECGGCRRCSEDDE